jgi:hypothetical protein
MSCAWEEIRGRKRQEKYSTAVTWFAIFDEEVRAT